MWVAGGAQEALVERVTGGLGKSKLVDGMGVFILQDCLFRVFLWLVFS